MLRFQLINQTITAMTITSTAVTPLIYVGTFAKFNSGSLFGDWFDLSDFSDMEEFLLDCRELHQDEDDPEFMFQDWEGIPAAFVSECSISSGYWRWLSDMVLLSENEQEAYTDYADEFNAGQVDIKQFREAYYGHFKSKVDFAEHHAEDNGYFETMEEAGIKASYFDAGAYANDLFRGDFWMSQKGHVFSA